MIRCGQFDQGDLTLTQHRRIMVTLSGTSAAEEEGMPKGTEIVTKFNVKTTVDGMSLRAYTILRWASRLLVLLVGIATVVATAAWLGPEVGRWATLAVAVLGFAARWCEQQLPSVRSGVASVSDVPPEPPQ